MTLRKEIEDKLRIKHADICLKCEDVYVRERGGRRFFICEKCAERCKQYLSDWDKYGLYLAEKQVIREEREGKL